MSRAKDDEEADLQCGTASAGAQIRNHAVLCRCGRDRHCWNVLGINLIYWWQ